LATNSKEYMRKWRESHPGYFKERQKEYYKSLDEETKKRKHRLEQLYQKDSLSHAVNKSKKWTEEDDKKLIYLYNNGQTANFIAKELGRSVYSIRSRIYYLKRVMPFKGKVGVVDFTDRRQNRR